MGSSWDDTHQRWSEVDAETEIRDLKIAMKAIKNQLSTTIRDLARMSYDEIFDQKLATWTRDKLIRVSIHVTHSAPHPRQGSP